MTDTHDNNGERWPKGKRVWIKWTGDRCEATTAHPLPFDKDWIEVEPIGGGVRVTFTLAELESLKIGYPARLDANDWVTAQAKLREARLILSQAVPVDAGDSGGSDGRQDP